MLCVRRELRCSPEARRHTQSVAEFAIDGDPKSGICEVPLGGFDVY